MGLSIRRQLLLSAALVLVLTSLALLGWQIIKKSLKSPPQTHSVVRFDAENEQVLAAGDMLTGKGIPEAKVSLILSPNGFETEVAADKEGKWSYQTPSTVASGKYNLTVILRDRIGVIADIKTYPVTIGSPKQSFNLIKPVNAQGNLPTVCDPNNPVCPAGTTCIVANPQSGLGYCDVPQVTTTPEPRQLAPLGPEYNDWVAWMHKLSIYPARDLRTGEIVFVNRDDYEREACNGSRCTPNPDFDTFTSQVRARNWQFLQYFGDYVRRQCFIAAEAMAPYFQDLTSISLDNGQVVNFFEPRDFPSLSFLHDAYPNCGPNVQHSFQDEQQFDNLLTAAANNYSFSNEDPFGDFYHATKVASLGFLPTDTFLKLYATTNGYPVTDDLVLDTVFATANVIPIARAGGGAVGAVSRIGSYQITSRTYMSFGFRSEVGPLTRRLATLQRDKRISQSAIQHEVDDIVGRYLDNHPPVVLPALQIIGGVARINRADLNNVARLTALFGQEITGPHATMGRVFGNGTIATKIIRDISSEPGIVIQRDVLQRANGAGGLAQLHFEVKDEFDHLVGFGMTQFRGKALRPGFADNPSLGERLNLMEKLRDIYEVTNRPHGDLALDFGDYVIFNRDNILFDATEGYRFIDWGSANQNLQIIQEVKGFIKAAFMGADSAGFPIFQTSPEIERIGRQLLDEINSGKSLREALAVVRNNPGGTRELTLTGIQGNAVPGNPLTVTAVITAGGIVVPNPSEVIAYNVQPAGVTGAGLVKSAYALTFPTTLGALQALAGAENCGLTCNFTLPITLTPGNYVVVGCLHDVDSTTLGDCDSEPLGVQSQASLTPSPTPPVSCNLFEQYCPSTGQCQIALAPCPGLTGTPSGGLPAPTGIYTLPGSACNTGQPLPPCQPGYVCSSSSFGTCVPATPGVATPIPGFGGACTVSGSQCGGANPPCCGGLVCGSNGLCGSPVAGPTIAGCKTVGQQCSVSGAGTNLTSNCCGGLSCSGANVCVSTSGGTSGTTPTPTQYVVQVPPNLYVFGCVFVDSNGDGKFNGVDRSIGSNFTYGCGYLESQGPEKGYQGATLSFTGPPGTPCAGVSEEFTSGASGAWDFRVGQACRSGSPPVIHLTSPVSQTISSFVIHTFRGGTGSAVADFALPSSVPLPTATPTPTPIPLPPGFCPPAVMQTCPSGECIPFYDSCPLPTATPTPPVSAYFGSIIPTATPIPASSGGSLGPVTLSSGTSSCSSPSTARVPLTWDFSQYTTNYDVLRDGTLLTTQFRARTYTDVNAPSDTDVTYSVVAKVTVGTNATVTSNLLTVGTPNCGGPTPPTTGGSLFVPTPTPTLTLQGGSAVALPTPGGQGGQGPTTQASPIQVVPGGTITVSWSGLTASDYAWVIAPTPFPPGYSPAFKYLANCDIQTPSTPPASSGSCDFSAPTTVGNYQFRLIHVGQPSPVVATSNTVMVGSSQPQQKQLVRITIDGQEVYRPGTSNPVQLDLRASRTRALVVEYIDEAGNAQSKTFALTFDKPKPPEVPVQQPPPQVCTSIDCAPPPPGCTRENAIPTSCDSNVAPTCGNIVCLGSPPVVSQPSPTPIPDAPTPTLVPIATPIPVPTATPIPPVPTATPSQSSPCVYQYEVKSAPSYGCPGAGTMCYDGTKLYCTPY